MEYYILASGSAGNCCALVNDKKEITPFTLEVLKEASRRGVYVVLASGRPIRGMMHLIKKYAF